MSNQPLNCLAVMRTLCLRKIGFFRHRNSKHATVITSYVVSFLVMCNIAFVSAATPERNMCAEFVDGCQMLRVTTKSDLSKWAVGVFPKVETNFVKGEAVGIAGFMSSPNGGRDINTKQNHEEGSSDTKQYSCIISNQINHKEGLTIGIIIGGLWGCGYATGYMLSGNKKPNAESASKVKPNAALSGAADILHEAARNTTASA